MTTTLIYRNSKIESYEEERPERKDSAYDTEKYYQRDLLAWQNSRKDYPFADGEEQKLCDFLKVFIDEFHERDVTGLVEIKQTSYSSKDKGSFMAYFVSPHKEEGSKMTEDDKLHALLGFWFSYSLAANEKDLNKQETARKKFFKQYDIIKRRQHE